MPLVKSTLLAELSSFADQKHSSFTEFPKTKEEAAEKWATAIDNYAGVVIPLSTTASVAKAAFQSTMMGLLNIAPQVDPLPQSFTAYALQLGLGQQPLFTAIPPPTPITFAAVFPVGLAGGSNADCLSLMCDIIDLWFKTGTTTNNASGVIVPWS